MKDLKNLRSLREIIVDLKNLIPDGIDVILEALKDFINESSPKYNEYIQLEARYKSNQRERLEGVIMDEESDVENNKIRTAILDLIDSLVDSDLKESDLIAPEQEAEIKEVKEAKKNKKGKLLYRIPDVMQIGIRTTCFIRIAFDEETLTYDITVQQGDDLHTLRRISDLMSVELIDPTNEEAFTIHTYSDNIQFLDKDDYTEWQFFVEPHKVGEFSLLVKVCVIEIINGKERKKVKILSEKVQIITETPVVAELAYKEIEDAFLLGIPASFGAVKTVKRSTSEFAETAAPEPTAPTILAEAASDTTSTTASESSNKSFEMARLLYILPVLLAAGIGWLVFSNNNTLNSSTSDGMAKAPSAIEKRIGLPEKSEVKTEEDSMQEDLMAEEETNPSAEENFSAFEQEEDQLATTPAETKKPPVKIKFDKPTNELHTREVVADNKNKKGATDKDRGGSALEASPPFPSADGLNSGPVGPSDRPARKPDVAALPPTKIATMEGIFKDNRDGQSYEWVRLLDGKKWMRKNIAYKIASGSWCLNDAATCAKKGRLYTWEAALKACPKGWHLPTDKEWQQMTNQYGGADDFSKEGGQTAFKAFTQHAGALALQQSGSREVSGRFKPSKDSHYWTSTSTKDINYAWNYHFKAKKKFLDRYMQNKKMGLSCRCVQ